MRIDRIHIDGFGIFHDYDLSGFSDGLSVIYGPNESGKSTILEFIRTVLFGFKGKGSTNRYPPLNGGKHGGRIFLYDSQNEKFTVESHADPKGGQPSVGSQDNLPPNFDQLLETVTPKLFQTVFAFSLSELEKFESLTNDDDVINYIYGAGMGVRNLDEIIKKITKQQDDLYKEKGRIQEIPELIKKIEATNSGLKKCRSSLDVYNNCLNDLENLTKQYDEKLSKRDDFLERKKHLEKCNDAWDDWIEIQNAKDRLRELPVVEDFPSDGISRLERLLEERDNFNQMITKSEQKISTLQSQLDSCLINQNILGKEREIENLSEGWDKYKTATDDLPTLIAKRDRLNNDLENSIAKELPGSWSKERVLAFDTSIVTREEIRSYENELSNAKQKLETAQKSLNSVARSEKNRKPLLASFVVSIIVIVAILLFLIREDVGAVILLVGVALGGIVWYLQSKKLENEVTNEITQADRDKRMAEQEFYRVQNQWHNWLATQRLDKDIEPSTCRDILASIGELCTKIQSVDELNKRIDLIETTICDYTKKINDTCNSDNVAIAGNENTTTVVRQYEQIRQIKQQLNEEKEKVQKREKLSEDIEERKKELDLQKDEGDKKEKQIFELLVKGCGVNTDSLNEDNFRKRSEIFDKRNKYLKTIEEHEKSLKKLVGGGAVLEEFKKRLEEWVTKGREKLEADISDYSDKIGEYNKELDENRFKQGGIHRDLEQLKTDEQESSLKQEYSCQCEELQDKVDNWAVFTVAQKLLRDSRLKYEKERQPEVVKRAQNFFSCLTNNRYNEVKSPIKSSSDIKSSSNLNIYVVEKATGKKRNVTELSRGTAEQLYLSLRFGLVGEFVAHHNEGLPMIMDDVLVNFDPNRAKQTCKVLKELSAANQQILLFTCHPETVELVREVTEDPVVLKL